MSGVVRIAWRESAEELYARYVAERDLTRRKRLQALWLVRQGRDEGAVSREAGVGRRSLQRWLGWYRADGLDAVLARVPGHKVVQRVQVRYEWRYLLLGVDPVRGQLRWRWVERLRQWQWEAVVWDGASAHRGKQVAALPLKRIALPPYSPELNPAERVFEEVRRHVEGLVYAAIVDKQAAVDPFLSALAADPARVRRLCGWGWLTASFAALPRVIRATFRRSWYNLRAE